VCVCVLKGEYISSHKYNLYYELTLIREFLSFSNLKSYLFGSKNNDRYYKSNAIGKGSKKKHMSSAYYANQKRRKEHLREQRIKEKIRQKRMNGNKGGMGSNDTSDIFIIYSRITVILGKFIENRCEEYNRNSEKVTVIDYIMDYSNKSYSKHKAFIEKEREYSTHTHIHAHTHTHTRNIRFF